MRRGGVFVSGLAFGVALGIAAGSLLLAPGLAGSADSRVAGLSTERDAAVQRVDAAQAQLQAADSVIDASVQGSIAGLLADQPVVVLYTADAQDKDVTKVRGLLAAAGAQDAGAVKLEESFFAQSGADGLKNIVSNVLPAGAKLSESELDPGTHAGETLGSLVTADPAATDAERAMGLGALRQAGYVSYTDGMVKPARAAVLVVGDGEDEFVVANEVRFAQAVDARLGGLVVAGSLAAAEPAGVIGAIRLDNAVRDRVSTVDSVDRSFGQLATVVAVSEQLAGQAGAYGAGDNALAAAPLPPKKSESALDSE